MNRRYSFATLLTAACLLGAAAQARAGQLSQGLTRSIEGKAGSEEIHAVIVLSDQAPIPQMNQDLRDTKAPMSVRHPAVIDALREAAARSQGPILQQLETLRASGAIREYRAFWIVNGVSVVGTIDAVRQLALRNDVEVVEPDHQIELLPPIQSEPAELRGGGGITPGVDNIEADRVWNELGIRGEGAIVANMDTGVDGNHPALASRWRGNFAPSAECWRDVVGSPSTFPIDNNGHGTHVMGTITGDAPGNSIGVAPAALWIANNTIDQGVGPAFDSDVIDGLQWFSDPDGNSGTLDDVPDVVQHSWRINENFPGGYTDCDSRWWTAIDNCEAAGVVQTWSAGNEGPGPMTVGSPPDRATTPYNVFSVGATIHSPPFTIASFSSRGPSGCGGPWAIKPEIAAPGVSIFSSWPGGGYNFLDGTSMAGPHVAGVVGLMRSANPDLDVDTIKQIIMDTATDLGAAGEDNTYGHGFINAYEAVLASLTGYGSIEGTVTDAVSGDPIEGVAIDVLSDPRETTTDEDGFFKVLLPAGTWSLEFSVFPYQTQTVPFDVVAQQITDGDVAMTTLPQVIVSGIVRDYTNALVEGATIRALGTPLSVATSLADGSYQLSVPDGLTYQIQARKNGFGMDVETVIVSGPETQDFVLPELTGEDFESGDFTIWPWVFTGNAPWTIDTNESHDGENSARSGVIPGNQSTTMEITLPVATAGNISFWLKTSSEFNLDLLRFYIDGVLKQSWSGETPWTQATFAVGNGEHTFRWTYSKNSSGTGGADAAWVDQVQFPDVGFPEVVLSASSMSATLAPDQQTSQTLTISNTGEGELDFLASVHGVPPIQIAVLGEVSVDGSLRGRVPGDIETRGSGGPDAFGYSWIDSDEPGGPNYQWIEISGIGQGLAAGNDTYSTALPLGFTFPFYNNNYTTVRVSANGFLSFSAPNGAYNLNSAIPATADPDDIIAGFWDDLNFLQGGTLHIFNDAANQRFITQWSNVPINGQTTNRQTFQIILNSDGSIVAQYKLVAAPTSCTVGIENATGTDGLQVVFNGAYLHNNLAIRYGTAPPVTWLTVAPPLGTVPPLGQVDLDVDYDATGLALGVYEALIRIATNDPDELVINVPVTLTVGAATDVETSVGLPTSFELAAPRPNPFSQSTTIRYAVPAQGQHVAISIFDVSGRRIRALVDAPQNAGYHQVAWDGRDEGGSAVTSGVYFYKMNAGSFEQVQKVTLLK